MTCRPFGDPEQSTAKLVAALTEAPRVGLPDADPPRDPGVYCLGLDVDVAQAEAGLRGPILRCLPPTLLQGCCASYVGAAKSLRERLLTRHRSNISTAEHLSASDFWAVWVPLDTVGAALHAEELVQAFSRAPFSENRLAGLGSRSQGGPRFKVQPPTTWDCLFRRSWAKPATTAEQLTAQVALATVLTRPDPSRVLWEPMRGPS